MQLKHQLVGGHGRQRVLRQLGEPGIRPPGLLHVGHGHHGGVVIGLGKIRHALGKPLLGLGLGDEGGVDVARRLEIILPPLPITGRRSLQLKREVDKLAGLLLSLRLQRRRVAGQ
ncbi:hypothetical protein D3C85_1388050 [compost metagenome]